MRRQCDIHFLFFCYTEQERKEAERAEQLAREKAEREEINR